MEILTLNKYWLNLIGGRPADVFSISILHKNILISSIIVLDLVPTLLFFAANITDLVKSTAAFYVVGVIFICITTYWNILAHRTDLDDLMHDLENMLRLSKHFETFNKS